jgi:DNA polymerase-3 subunit gamma/tau
VSYQVIARRWRPKRFDEIVGQPGVTQTLTNAIRQGRLGQAFVFAGPRGVGKTTTARILARALNCVAGPTAEPCGTCEACREIAEGRDIDVLEIDAATHTQVDNVREVIIAGLAMSPVRDRFKIFIIDEFHQLSSHSFNALLKSIEEPPPHVVFMMATTELHRIPDTILSRSQVFEFRQIGTRAIADQLAKIAAVERIEIEPDAVQALARVADGSMRDAQSALDQVLAFATGPITAGDVATVLGLVGRDLLFDIAGAVADEDAAAMFDLAGRAVEAGFDLKMVCRELARLVRDLLVLSIDPSRYDDPEIAPESQHERLRALGRRFSREDLLRAFDVLSHAEAEIRQSAQPRYTLEMALVRWAHLRKLVPLAELLEGFRRSGGAMGVARASTVPGSGRTSGTPSSGSPHGAPAVSPAGGSSIGAAAAASPPRDRAFVAPGSSPAADAPVAAASGGTSVAPGFSPARDPDPAESGAPVTFKDALLAEIRRSKRFLYNTVVAQAQRIEIGGDAVTFTFSPVQRALRTQLDQVRPWLESVAAGIAGRPIRIVTAQSNGGEPAAAGSAAAAPDADRKAALKARAMADASVQAVLDVFGAKIRDVEEI